MKKQRTPRAIAVCIGCGCDDLHACEDAVGEPCGWIEVDRDLGIGICSGHGTPATMRRAYAQLRLLLRSRARTRARELAHLAQHLEVKRALGSRLLAIEQAAEHLRRASGSNPPPWLPGAPPKR